MNGKTPIVLFLATLMVIGYVPVATSTHGNTDENAGGDPWTWAADLDHWGADSPMEPNTPSDYTIGSAYLTGDLRGVVNDVPAGGGASGLKNWFAVQRFSFDRHFLTANLAAGAETTCDANTPVFDDGDPTDTTDPADPNVDSEDTFKCPIEFITPTTLPNSPGSVEDLSLITRKGFLPINSATYTSLNTGPLVGQMTYVNSPWTERLPQDPRNPGPIKAPDFGHNHTTAYKVLPDGNLQAVTLDCDVVTVGAQPCALGISAQGSVPADAEDLPWGCWRTTAAGPYDNTIIEKIPGQDPGTTSSPNREIVSNKCGLWILNPNVGGPTHIDPLVNKVFIPKQAFGLKDLCTPPVPPSTVPDCTGAANLKRIKDRNEQTEGLYFDYVGLTPRPGIVTLNAIGSRDLPFEFAPHPSIGGDADSVPGTADDRTAAQCIQEFVKTYPTNGGAEGVYWNPKGAAQGCASLFQGLPGVRIANGFCSTVPAAAREPVNKGTFDATGIGVNPDVDRCPYDRTEVSGGERPTAGTLLPNGNYDRTNLPAFLNDGAAWYTARVYWGYARDLDDNYPTGGGIANRNIQKSSFANGRIDNLGEGFVDPDLNTNPDSGKFYQWSGNLDRQTASVKKIGVDPDTGQDILEKQGMFNLDPDCQLKTPPGPSLNKRTGGQLAPAPTTGDCVGKGFFNELTDRHDEFRALIDFGKPRTHTTPTGRSLISDKYDYVSSIHEISPQFGRSQVSAFFTNGGTTDSLQTETIGSNGVTVVTDPDGDWFAGCFADEEDPLFLLLEERTCTTLYGRAATPEDAQANRVPELRDDSCDIAHEDATATCGADGDTDHPTTSYTGESCRIDTLVTDSRKIGAGQPCPGGDQEDTTPLRKEAWPGTPATERFVFVSNPLNPLPTESTFDVFADDHGDGCADVTDELGLQVQENNNAGPAELCDADEEGNGIWVAERRNTDMPVRNENTFFPYYDGYVDGFTYAPGSEWYGRTFQTLFTGTQNFRQLDFIGFVDTAKNDKTDLYCAAGTDPVAGCTAWHYRTRSELSSLFSDNYIDIDTYAAYATD